MEADNSESMFAMHLGTCFVVDVKVFFLENNLDRSLLAFGILDSLDTKAAK